MDIGQQLDKITEYADKVIFEVFSEIYFKNIF